MTEEKNMVNEGLNTLVFNNDEFGNIRTVILNNNPWFVGKDVAECLGYTNSKKAIRDHVDDEDKIMGERNVTPSSLQWSLSAFCEFVYPKAFATSLPQNKTCPFSSNVLIFPKS